jgi:hypothetical protein
MDMDMQHGHGHAACTLTCSMDVYMHHRHGHAVWTWTCRTDMDVDMDKENYMDIATLLRSKTKHPKSVWDENQYASFKNQVLLVCKTRKLHKISFFFLRLAKLAIINNIFAKSDSRYGMQSSKKNFLNETRCQPQSLLPSTTVLCGKNFYFQLGWNRLFENPSISLWFPVNIRVEFDGKRVSCTRK